MSKRYGWWSASAAERGGYTVYRGPNGEEVYVTCVTDSPDDHGTGWQDAQFKGEVTEAIRGFKPNASRVDEKVWVAR